MSAAILAVGSELLGTDRLDTNSLRLAEVLERHGVELVTKAVIGDSEAGIAREVGRLLDLAGLVLVTGGLGPTADDVTRTAVAHALGRGLHFSDEVLASIAARFAAIGLRMPEVNRRQAEVIDGATLIDNRRGTAPGLRIDDPRGTLFLFPGVPVELEGMIASDLEPWLAARSAGRGRERAVLKVAGLPESTVEERVAPAYGELGRENVSVLAKPGEILIQFWATGTETERRERLAAMSRRLRALVGDAVFTDDPEADLAGVVGDLLRRRGATLATAESCTGGWLGQRLTAVAGSSAYYPGGVVTYSNELKQRLLGVPAELLAAQGAVSEAVARAMADGARRRLGADYGLGITGVAGPGGGSDDKPVGTVHIALAGPSPGDSTPADPTLIDPTQAGPSVAGPGVDLDHRRLRFPGDRERVRWLATQVALEMLRRHLLATEGPRLEAPVSEAAGPAGPVGVAGSGTARRLS